MIWRESGNKEWDIFLRIDAIIFAIKFIVILYYIEWTLYITKSQQE